MPCVSDMKYKFTLNVRHRELITEFEKLNTLRTEGRWNPDNIVFPPGDPDTEFVEFITEHADELIKLINAYYC